MFYLFEQVKVMKLPIQPQICKVMNFNSEDSNSVITNYYQYGPSDVKNMAMIDLVVVSWLFVNILLSWILNL